MPEISQADPNNSLTLESNSGIEDHATEGRWLNRITERIREVAEQCWGNSDLRDENPRSRSEDEEGIDPKMTGDEENDEDRDDDDDDLFAESDVTGISTWDMLGEDFEREAASVGVSLTHNQNHFSC